MNPRVVTDDALQLRAHEQKVILDALREYEEREVREGDVNFARIADRLREDIRKGRALRGIAEIPA